MVIRRRLLATAIVLGLSACNWPMPGHDANRSSFNPFEHQLTSANVDGLSELFHVPVADGTGPPVIAGGALYVTSYADVRAHDPVTGGHRWTRTFPNGNGVPAPNTLPRASGPFFGPAAGPVLVGADYAQLMNGDTSSSHSLELDPATGVPDLGSVRTEGFVVARRGSRVLLVRSPRLLGGRGSETVASVVDLTSVGPPAWTGTVFTEFMGTARFRPTLGTRFVWADLNGRIVAYDLGEACTDPLACDPSWSLSIDVTSPVSVSADERRIYFGTGLGDVVALDAETGAPRFTVDLGSPVTVTPALGHGNLYMTAGGSVGVVPAAGCGTSLCRPEWWFGFDGAAVGTQPAIAGGVVYLGTTDGRVGAFDAAGCGQTSCPPLWTGEVEGSVTGLAVATGRLYVSTSAGVTAFAVGG